LITVLVGSIGAAISPRYASVALVLAGAGAWVLMQRYYGARHPALASVFRWRGDDGVATSRWAAPLCIALLALSGMAWLAIVGINPRLPDGVSPADAFWMIGMVSAAPINEEVLFRGVVFFGLLACRCRPLVAFVVQALLFTAVHGFHNTAFQTSMHFLSGIAFALIALHHGGLVQAMVVHASWNLIEHFRAILSGSLAPDSSLGTAWHTALPPAIGIVLTILVLMVLNRRYDAWRRVADLAREQPRNPQAAEVRQAPPAAPT
jgi:membrane protease YdiL (CAAX protease family)